MIAATIAKPQELPMFTSALRSSTLIVIACASVFAALLGFSPAGVAQVARMEIHSFQTTTLTDQELAWKADDNHGRASVPQGGDGPCPSSRPVAWFRWRVRLCHRLGTRLQWDGTSHVRRR